MKKVMFSLLAAALLCAPAMAQSRMKYMSTMGNSLAVNELQMDKPAQVNRFLFAGYNTLCLPMTLSSEQLQAAATGVRLERLAAIRQEGDALCLYFIDCTDEGLLAGYPYLVFSPKMQNLVARTDNALAVSTDLQAVAMSDATGNSILFTGSWESVAGDAQRYGIPAKQDAEVLESVLLPTSADKNFLPTRCGIVWQQQAATANRLLIRHASADEATAINAIAAEGNDASIFDLSGRRVRNAQHGIYVIDGKKKAVK